MKELETAAFDGISWKKLDICTFKDLIIESAECFLLEEVKEVDDYAYAYQGAKNLSLITVADENKSIRTPMIDVINGKVSELLGFHEIEGFPFLGFNLGGDCEKPVFAVIVSDGEDLYSYIPVKGNCYNEKFLEAYGNNNDEEEGDKAYVDYKEIIKDLRIAFCIDNKSKEAVKQGLGTINERVENLCNDIEAMTDEKVGLIMRHNLTEIMSEIKDLLEKN